MDSLDDLSLENLAPDDLARLADAAREIRTCQRVLAKTGDTILTELLRGQGVAHEWRHYPPGDVYDAEYHAQYYYHCHPAEDRRPGEHGHFHTFLRPFGMPAGVRPAPLSDNRAPLGENDALSHLVGVSVSASGEVNRLFTTNRWVTGETWYVAADVTAMLDCFIIDHARPSWPLNRWMSAVVRLFRPQIVALLAERDAAVAAWAASHPKTNVFEDRGLEIPSEIAVNIGSTLSRIEQAQRAARRRSDTPLL